jgi:hypothetical protein
MRDSLVLIAVILGLIGTSTLVMLAVLPFGRTPLSEIDPILVLLASLYSLAALLSARKLWRLSPSGPQIFIAWCVSTVAYNLYLSKSVPEFWNPWLIPAYILLLALLAWVYIYTRRICRPAA